jgi:hypothetical protein
MNVNVKISISDEDRNLMFRRLTGKDTKGMVSRADVNTWVKEQLERFLTVGSPTTERVEEIEEREPINIDDFTQQDIEDVIKQNELLLKRVNEQQNFIDRKLNKTR